MSVVLETIYPSEGSSRTVTFTLLDDAGVVVPLANIDAARVTLSDLGTYEAVSPTIGIINGREGQDVLNANNVTIHATSGLVTFAMQPADNPVVTNRRQAERHRVLFHFDVNGAILEYEFEAVVKNLTVLV